MNNMRPVDYDGGVRVVPSNVEHGRISARGLLNLVAEAHDLFHVAFIAARIVQVPLRGVVLGHEAVNDPARRIDRDQKFPAVNAHALDARAVMEFCSEPRQGFVNDGISLDGFRAAFNTLPTFLETLKFGKCSHDA